MVPLLGLGPLAGVHPVLVRSLTPEGGFGPERLLWLAAVVFIGAVLPILPTGAAVTSTAVLAEQAPPELALVVILGAAGAWAGDVSTLALMRWGGGRLLGRLVARLSRGGTGVARATSQLRRHDTRVLVVSRLVPGARIPVLFAAAGGALDPRRYATHDVAACILWAVLYAGVGVAGRSLFGSPAVAIVVAVAFVVVASFLAGEIEQRRQGAPPRSG